MISERRRGDRHSGVSGLLKLLKRDFTSEDEAIELVEKCVLRRGQFALQWLVDEIMLDFGPCVHKYGSYLNLDES